MKIVVQLDAENYFAGFSNADESPLEPDIFLYPAGCIDAPSPLPITDGFRARWNGFSWDEIKEPDPELPAATNTPAGVTVERDRRLGLPFQFGEKTYDCDSQSLARITGAATLAGFAMGAGAEAGNLRWHGGDSDFAWIAHDNTLTEMDAPTCFAFGQAAANNQSSIIFAAKALKAMDPIPLTYTDDRFWP